MKAIDDDNPRRRLLFPKLTEPDWGVWRSISNAELWEVVALSCGIDPSCLIGWTEPRPITNAPLTNFHNQLRKAVASLEENGGGLHRLAGNMEHRATRIGLGDFRAWAISEGWLLPDQFPCFAAIRPQQSESPEQRQERLQARVNAEMRAGNAIGKAREIVAATEPSHRPEHGGQRITAETLRKILARKQKPLATKKRQSP